MISAVLFWLGSFLVILGGVFDFLAALGMLRFPNFYVRLHAATIGAIYGAVLPLIGVALLALGLEGLEGRFIIAGGALVTAMILLIVSPIGSHVLAYATHKAGVVKWEPVVDHLKEDETR